MLLKLGCHFTQPIGLNEAIIVRNSDKTSRYLFKPTINSRRAPALRRKDVFDRDSKMYHALKPTSYICVRALVHHDQAGGPVATHKDPVEALFQYRPAKCWDDNADIFQQRFMFEFHLINRA